MKICISSSGPSHDSMVDPRFGRCQYLAFVSDKKNFEIISNPAYTSWQGAGVTTAQEVVNRGVSAVITGNIGPNAFRVLNMSGVKIYSGVFDISLKEALQKFLTGELKEMTMPTVPGHFGMGAGGGGFGLGFGGGRCEPGGRRFGPGGGGAGRRFGGRRSRR
jgi:predicted Fe-Mo cluster-binding NifX family protein